MAQGTLSAADLIIRQHENWKIKLHYLFEYFQANSSLRLSGIVLFW